MGAAARPAILISGYHGFGNLGDEAVLAGMVQSLRARLGPVPLIVLSADPAATVRDHGVEAVPRQDLPAILGAMRRSRLFLSGGGSLLQDATSVRSAVYYLGLLRAAQRLVPRTMVYAAGLGPLHRPLLRRLAGRALDRTDVVSVRDRDSAALVRALGVRTEPLLGADPAVVLHPADPGNASPASGQEEAPLIGAVVRPWRDSTFVRPLGEALAHVATRVGARVMVLPFHPAVDMPIARDLAGASGGTLIALPPHPAAGLAAVARMQVLVGLRLHALLFAAMAGVPPVGLAYDPKVTALFRDLEIGGPLPLDADAATLARAIQEAWEQRIRLRPALQTATAALRARAEAPAAAAARLYTAS